MYVGDHVNDYLAAKNAGLLFVGVTTGLHTKEDFIGAGLNAYFILDSVQSPFLAHPQPPQAFQCCNNGYQGYNMVDAVYILTGLNNLLPVADVQI